MLDQLRTGDAPQLAVQQRVPIALTHLLPTGLRGFFCVMMIFLLITTQDTYMHSWGSIFIQDVVMPLRRRPLTPAQHVNWLRGSIIFVAVFAIVFAALYQPNEYIQMYFAITGSITAGLGCAIIGGLYWRYGGTLAAYVAMALGAILSVGRIVVHQYKVEIAAIPDKGLLLQFLNWQNEINSQWIWFFIMLICIVSYIVLSLLARREPFDLERMLHRGKYDIRQEHKSAADAIRSSWLKVVGITEEFTRVDRLLALALVLWNGFWVFVFVVAAIYNFTVQRISIEWWVWFWIVWIWIQVVAGVIATVWFSIGGVLDIRSVLHRLSTLQRDERDDGTIVGRHMAADEGTIVAEGNDAEADEEDGG